MDRLTYIHIHIRIRLHNNFDIIKFNLSWSHFGLFNVFAFNDVCFSMQSEILCCFLPLPFNFRSTQPAPLRIKQRYGKAEQHLCK